MSFIENSKNVVVGVIHSLEINNDVKAIEMEYSPENVINGIAHVSFLLNHVWFFSECFVRSVMQ